MIYFIGTSNEFKETEEMERCTIEYALEYFKDKKYIQLDTETEGFDPYTKNIICWQIGDYDNQFVIEQKDYPFENYKKFFEDSNKTFLLQNAKFDLRFFFHKQVNILNVYDTFLAEKLIYLDKKWIRLSLDHLVKRYCGVEDVDKSIRGQIHFRGLDNTVIQYAAGDVKFLEKIKEGQELKLNRLDLMKNLSLQNKYCPVLAYCEYCGFKIDKDAWAKIYENNLSQLKATESEMDDWVVQNMPKYRKKQLDLFLPVSCDINWNSSDQVIPLFEDLGLNLWIEDNGEKKKSVGYGVVSPQKDKSELIPLYLKYSKLQKAVSTYGLNVIQQINPVSGRLHTQFNQIMNTGRLSSGGTDKSTGTKNLNFQNIPSDKAMRSCFIAEEGNTLVVADYSG